MTLDQIVPVLQLSIGPVILISGAGLVLLSMTNRMGRVIDRARSLAESFRNATDSDSPRIKRQLDILVRRSRLLRSAIAFTTICLLLAALLVIALFLFELMSIEAAKLVIVLFILCLGSLIVGLVYFLADINLGLSALKIEIDVEPQKGNKA